ncbi:hypothetical protein CBL_01589 [Carabus blaptoides fortunei]
MLSKKDFFKIFLYTLVILVCIKLSIHHQSFVYKLHDYNKSNALEKGMKNPYILQKLKHMTEVIPQNLYAVCNNVVAYIQNIVQPAQ